MGIKRLKSGKWQIDYYFNGRRYRESYPNKKLAEQALWKRKIEIAEGKFLEKVKEKEIKFSDFSLKFLTIYSKINKRSWKRDELSIKHLNKFFGEKELHKITSLDIEVYKSERLKQNVKKSTINRELACLKTILRKGVEWGYLKKNPPLIKLYRENTQRVRYLTREEIIKIFENAQQPLRDIIIIALNTGMRLGEILNLKWVDIDFFTKTIYIKESKSGERRIPITDNLCHYLLAKRMSESHNIKACDMVFPNISKYQVSHKFKKLVNQLGIKDFRFHDLRHTFASYFVMMGGNLRVLQEFLGHKTFTMTLRYSHLAPDYKREIINQYENYIGMDTLWTPEVKFNDKEKVIEKFNQLIYNELQTKSRDGGKEDATDLKSVGSLLP